MLSAEIVNFLGLFIPSEARVILTKTFEENEKQVLARSSKSRLSKALNTSQPPLGPQPSCSPARTNCGTH
ncbi:hypothetical protein BDR06DRAFT_642120 [Suillus hirtellus]|nr:hypothetical protein BDR06DRAFT_642120 [Suillus hirtellus]